MVELGTRRWGPLRCKELSDWCVTFGVLSDGSPVVYGYYSPIIRLKGTSFMKYLRLH